MNPRSSCWQVAAAVAGIWLLGRWDQEDELPIYLGVSEN